MKQDNNILLKDLCCRLPYRVKCQIKEFGEKFFTLKSINIDYKNGHLLTFEEKINNLPVEVYLSEVKPCLFSMSSITKEQIEEYKSLCIKETTECADLSGFFYTKDNYYDTIESFDWLNKNNFDYHDLIPEGRAVDATGLNIYPQYVPYNEETKYLPWYI